MAGAGDGRFRTSPGSSPRRVHRDAGRTTADLGASAPDDPTRQNLDHDCGAGAGLLFRLGDSPAALVVCGPFPCLRRDPDCFAGASTHSSQRLRHSSTTAPPQSHPVEHGGHHRVTGTRVSYSAGEPHQRANHLAPRRTRNGISRCGRHRRQADRPTSAIAGSTAKPGTPHGPGHRGRRHQARESAR